MASNRARVSERLNLILDLTDPSRRQVSFFRQIESLLEAARRAKLRPRLGALVEAGRVPETLGGVFRSLDLDLIVESEVSGPERWRRAAETFGSGVTLLLSAGTQVS